MVPGFVAGDYAARELEIDVVPLARRAGARVVLAAATALDPEAKRIALEGRPALAYDVASLDVGSTVRGLELPGVREHALATRPIRGFVDRLDAALAAARARRGGAKLRVAVVGGGAAGVELAFTLEARLRSRGRAPPRFALVADSEALLPGAARRLARAAAAEAARRGIRLRLGARVSRVEADRAAARRRGGRPSRRTSCSGPRAPRRCRCWPSVAAPKDAQGFLRVRDTFQCLGSDDLFAAGDCAALDAHPWVPKAGVYAVRAGPILDANLRARLAGRALRRYRPQRDFLALLNLGERRALGGKWGVSALGARGVAAQGPIDRRFVARFRALDLPPMAGEPMACGGCAAKLDAARARARARRAAARARATPPCWSGSRGPTTPPRCARRRATC